MCVFACALVWHDEHTAAFGVYGDVVARRGRVRATRDRGGEHLRRIHRVVRAGLVATLAVVDLARIHDVGEATGRRSCRSRRGSPWIISLKSNGRPAASGRARSRCSGLWHVGAQLGVVVAVVAVERELLVAVVALVDVDDRATRHGRGVGDRVSSRRPTRSRPPRRYSVAAGSEFDVDDRAALEERLAGSRRSVRRQRLGACLGISAVRVERRRTARRRRRTRRGRRRRQKVDLDRLCRACCRCAGLVKFCVVYATRARSRAAVGVHLVAGCTESCW